MEKQVMASEMIHLPRRNREAHKGDFGKVAIVGGCVGYSGAPILAARAAVRTGAGLVSVLVPEPVWPIAACKLDSAMPWPCTAEEDGSFSFCGKEEISKQLKLTDAVLVGPGLGRSEGAAKLARFLCRRLGVPLVLDADGINALEEHIDCLEERRDRVTVLTPHEGEFMRIGGYQAHPRREEAALAFANTHNCVLVLKGHKTLTAFPDGTLIENQTGNPGMAKGGSGDVLAGMILSMLGQGFPLKQAVPWAVCLHGKAGDLAAEERGEYGMTPMDLVERIPAVIKNCEE